MIEGIEKYRKFVKEQDEREAGLLPVDPRSEEERMKSIELLEKVSNEMSLTVHPAFCFIYRKIHVINMFPIVYQNAPIKKDLSP